MSLRDTPATLKKCAIAGILMLGLAIPWSSALFRLSFPLIFISIFCGVIIAIKYDSSLKADLKSVAMEPSTWLISLFVFWVIASGVWTMASMKYYQFDASQYLKLLMIPALAFLIKNTLQNKGRWLILIYLTGVLILTLPTALDALGVFKYFNIDTLQYRNASYRDGSFLYFRNHIVHGFHVGVFAAIILLHVTLYVKNRLVGFLMVIYALCDILFWTTGRMALLGLFVGLIFSFTISNENPNELMVRMRKGKFPIVVTITLAISIAIMIWLGWDNVHSRYLSVVSEVDQYLKKPDVITSAGTRMHFWLISINMFFDSWLIGAGSGAFRHTLEVGKDAYFETGYSHTHNEYLTILSQFGLVGFLLFFGIIYLLIKEALRHPDPWIGKGFLCLLVVFSVNALSDSSLYNQWEGWTLVYFSAVMLGTRRV